MAIVIDSVSALHEHGTELEDLLSEGTGAVLLRGDRVREGEGVESHIEYIRRVYLDLRCAFYKKRAKRYFFLKSTFRNCKLYTY